MQLCMYIVALFSAGYWNIKSVHLIFLIDCKYMFFGLPESPRWPIATSVRPSFINIFLQILLCQFLPNSAYGIYMGMSRAIVTSWYVKMRGFNIGVNTVKFMHFCIKKNILHSRESSKRSDFISIKKHGSLYHNC